MGVGRTPTGLLLDKGVLGQRAVGSTSVKVQHRSPLWGAAHGQGAVTVPPGQRGHGREKSVEVTYIRTHFWLLTKQAPAERRLSSVLKSKVKVSLRSQDGSRPEKKCYGFSFFFFF